jgi:hypothetical protein
VPAFGITHGPASDAPSPAQSRDGSTLSVRERELSNGASQRQMHDQASRLAGKPAVPASIMSWHCARRVGAHQEVENLHFNE